MLPLSNSLLDGVCPDAPAQRSPKPGGEEGRPSVNAWWQGDASQMSRRPNSAPAMPGATLPLLERGSAPLYLQSLPSQAEQPPVQGPGKGGRRQSAGYQVCAFHENAPGCAHSATRVAVPICSNDAQP